jgi:hypothetical protein
MFLLKQKTTATQIAVVVSPISLEPDQPEAFHSLVLTIDRPFGWLLPNRDIFLPDLEQFVYNFVRHFADKIAVALSSPINH